MKHLSTKKYWDSVYERNNVSYFSNSTWANLKFIMRNYADYLIWEKIFPQYLEGDGKNAIEIGCAPGKNLVALNKRFGFNVYGLDYSPPGILETKDTFQKASLPVENIIEGDFFDESLIGSYNNFFDLVYSKGFIEHFSDPERVVKNHASIAKKGGKIIVQIPNLSGLNFCLSKFFNPVSHSLHNVGIMNMEKFSALFPGAYYSVEFMGYVGGFNIGLFNTNSRIKRKIHLFLYYFIQQPLNFVLRIISGVLPLESKFTSPYLLAILTKK